MSLVLLIACGLSLVVLIVLIAGIILIMQSGPKDAVGAARQGWMDSQADSADKGD